MKGGTALNLYHADLPRLSVDADLNYIGQLPLEEMARERPLLFRGIEAVANELGYAPVVEKDDHALRMYRLGYTGANGNHDHILLDLNFLERVPVLVPVASRSPSKALEVQSPPVQCLNLAELAGSKVATLLLRGACRDLFDVATLAGRKDVDWRLAKKIALFHGFLADVGLGTMRLDRVQETTQADHDRELRNLLRKGHEVSLHELKAAAGPVAEAVLRLDEGEEACHEALQRGHWRPDLLFGDCPVNPDVARHPGMEWRLRNPHARMPR